MVTFSYLDDMIQGFLFALHFSVFSIMFIYNFHTQKHDGFFKEYLGHKRIGRG